MINNSRAFNENESDIREYKGIVTDGMLSVLDKPGETVYLEY